MSVMATYITQEVQARNKKMFNRRVVNTGSDF